MILESYKANPGFVQYLRGIFETEEEINSIEDVRKILDNQLLRINSNTKTDVDLYFEELTNGSREFMEDEEETKGGEIQNKSYLEKCKAIGKVGPLVCKMNFRDSFGNWYDEGKVFLPS